MSSITNPIRVPIPLPSIAHAYAKENAVRQRNNEQARSVYFRTLAVYAVHSYLRCVSIDTDLEDSNLWNGIYDDLSDSSNLVLPDIGQLECCPIQPNAESFVPPQVMREDRIAYIAVQLKDTLDEVELIGFRPILNPSSPPSEIYIDDFQAIDSSDNGYSLFSIEHLLQYLYWIEDLRQGLETAKAPVVDTIRQWLEDKAYSLSQFSVEVIARLKGCEPDLMISRTRGLLVSLFSDHGVVGLTPGLMNSNLDSRKNSDSENFENDEALDKIAEDFMEWVNTAIL